MSARFAIFGLVLAGIVACAFSSLQSSPSGVYEIFLWLALLLLVCGIALWPTTGRDQRAELELERPSWADRVEFTEPPPAGRNAAPSRGAPVGSGTSHIG